MGAAGIGLLFTGISSGLQVYSQMQAGKTAERVAKFNAENLEVEARNKESEFVEATKRARINQRRNIGTLRARLSTQGTRADTGTAPLIMGDYASAFELAIDDAARATNMEAASLRQAGKMAIWEGKQVKKASTMSAIGTSLSGVTSAVSAYGHNKYTGAFK
jgi:hypothetical protein